MLHIEAGLQSWPLPILLLLLAGLIVALGKGADLLVDEAVRLSVRWKMPKILVGATIVSVGTTIPEAVVSVLAAIKGEPGIALGNAVGSIICDTGLILGAATLLSPLPLKSAVVNRQGWLQFAAGILLVVACIPIFSIRGVFQQGGMLPQFMGILFLFLLVGYLWTSVQWARNHKPTTAIEPEPGALPNNSYIGTVKLLTGMALVLTASHFLIPTVRITAIRLSVPQGIISATLVAFGTSLPELVTAITAVRKHHGELAVGNVIGADILNVLFVAGAAASVSPQGLIAPPHFFQVLFPAMLLVLFVFRAGVHFSGNTATLRRPFGVILLGTYIAVTFLSYSLHRHPI
jgi:cation:H+ antiporter